jgi:membrane-bound serine protease (ClpP class)
MRPSRVVAVLCVVLAAWASASAASAQPADEPPIDVIKVEGSIDGPLLGFLDERLDVAVADGAIVVLQLDSAGTMGEDAQALADRIANLPVPVIVWVGTVPARASGAALLLMYASSIAAVAPGSQTGPLDPIDLLEPDRTWPGLDQEIDGWLAARGRDVDRSYEDRALTAQEALDHGFAEYAAVSVPELLNELDGTQVPTQSGPVTLDTAIATTDEDIEAGVGVSIRFNEPGPIKRIQHGVASPSMIYVLLLAGIACLAFELTQPGFGFAGFAGLFLLALGLYGIVIVPPDWLGLAVLLAGNLLLVLDVQLRRLGVLSIVGGIAFLLGSFLVYGGVADAVRISPWLIAGMTLAAILYYGFGLTVAIQSRDRILSTQRGLIGLIGEARGRLAPDGPVYVKGALWRGRSLGDPIPPGAKVRVRGVDGLTLKVEAEPSTGDGTDADTATSPETEPTL